MPFSRFRPWIILAFLWVAYFHPLIPHPTQTLYSDYSDLLSEHLPARVYLVREWRSTGELPLWNPYHFCGAPFVHDIQVGTFYPPYAVTFLFHESCAGAVMSWAIALHVLAASIFAYFYARSRGLGEAGSLVTGVAFAYSAKWLTHLLLAGHTITIGLAWLPLVLLGLESFQRTGRLLGILGGGVAFALLILGTHPQWTFYSGLFIAAWTIPAERTKRNLGRWALGGLGVVVIAVLLTAVQLLPTWEASQYSSRNVGLASSQSLVVGVYSLLGMFGPSPRYDPPASWELRALLSLFGLAAALAAPLLAPASGRGTRIVLIAMLVFSFGGAVLLEWLPGFNLFRAASRMLLIAAFPVAFLAGQSTHAMIASGWSAANRLILGRAVQFTALAAIPSLLMLNYLLPIAAWRWSEIAPYWIAAGVGFVAACMACFAKSLSVRTRTGLWLAALLLELLAPTTRFVNVKPQADIYPDSDVVQFLNANVEPGSSRVIDVELGDAPWNRVAPLGIGSPQALTHRLAMPRGYNPLDVRHYREYVNFIMGGDEPVLSLGLVAQPIIPNFSRNETLLWNSLNVRYLVCFDDHVLNGDERGWRLAARFETTPPVPALPPHRPDPLPGLRVMENVRHRDNPRAFVVPDSASMPPGQELQALKRTDLHKTVLLAASEPPTNSGGRYRPVAVREYSPNRVAIDLASEKSGGWLVLADVWFPGWTCRVDGVEAPALRANHAFRAVAIPAGAKEAVFRFEPRSYRLGWWISAISMIVAVTCGGSNLLRNSSMQRRGAARNKAR